MKLNFYHLKKIRLCCSSHDIRPSLVLTIFNCINAFPVILLASKSNCVYGISILNDEGEAHIFRKGFFWFGINTCFDICVNNFIIQKFTLFVFACSFDLRTLL